MSWIGLLDGGRVDFANPLPEQIRLKDIARGLARHYRFDGHTTVPYTVAQHSVLAYEHIASDNPRVKLAALLHDASEAYLSDLNRPAKLLCPEYKAIEARLMRVIAARYDFPWPLPHEVKEVDNRLLMTEKRDLQPEGPEWTGDWPEPFDFRLGFSWGKPVWDPATAEKCFLNACLAAL